MRLQQIDSNYFCGKNHVKDDGTQNYLVFQPVYRYFKNIANSNISAWKSKGFSEVLNLLLHLKTVLFQHYITLTLHLEQNLMEVVKAK